MAKQFLEAGRIVGTHGVRGEMRVEPWCDSAEFLKKVKHLYFDEGRKDAGLTASRVHKSQLLIKLESVNSATEADLYRGKILYLDRKDVRLPKNRYFIEDLIGLSVEDNDTGKVYGELREVFPTGANNVYRIVNEKGEEFLGVPVKVTTCLNVKFEGNKFSALSEGKNEKIFSVENCSNVTCDGEVIS